MNITVINDTKGVQVLVHEASCGHVARDIRNSDGGNYYTETATSKYQAWYEYNQDFIEEAIAMGDEDPTYNAYPFTWEPCTKSLPAK